MGKLIVNCFNYNLFIGFQVEKIFSFNFIVHLRVYFSV